MGLPHFDPFLTHFLVAFFGLLLVRNLIFPELSVTLAGATLINFERFSNLFY